MKNIKSLLRKSSFLVRCNETRKDCRDFTGDKLGIVLCKLAKRKVRAGYNPLITVLLTTYNRPLLLETAIQSVLTQTYQNIELIVLDDNSGVETEEAIQRYLLNEAKFRYYKSDVKDEDRWKEARYAALFNIGLKMAKGELIAYLTDDDYYLPYKFEEFVEFFATHPKVKIAYNQQAYLPQRKLRKAFGVLRRPGHIVDCISVVHHKSCIDELGDWETGKGKKDVNRYIVGADDPFFNRLARKYPFYPIRKVLDIRINHADTISEKMNQKLAAI